MNMKLKLCSTLTHAYRVHCLYQYMQYTNVISWPGLIAYFVLDELCMFEASIC